MTHPSSIAMKTTTPSYKNRIFVLAALFAAALFIATPAAFALNFPGNGNTGFGGPVGNGTLSVTDDGTNITFTLLRGGGNLNDVLAIYIDTGVTGGYADTSTFTDIGGDDRKGIAGYNGTSRSVMTFTNGFRPKYAIAVKADYMDLFDLSNPANFNYITGAGQGGSGSGSFTLTIQATQLGLTPGVSSSFKIFGTLTAASAYRSTEAIAGNDLSSGGQGSIPFTQTAYGTYTFDAVAPILYPVRFQVDMSVQATNGNFHPDAGDTVYAHGSFQSSPWSGFQLTNDMTALNTNIYSGTYLDPNPTNTAEQYKYVIHVGASSNYEGVDNRPFTLTAPGVTNALVYYNDVAPADGAQAHVLTFQINLTPQIQLGHFNPGVDAVEVLGTFLTPNKWSEGFQLTNNPSLSGSASNLYSGTYIDRNYSGSWENYKFVIAVGGTNSGTLTYESGNNRNFFTPAGNQVFTTAFFNNISSVYSIPVTFSVDMTVPLLSGQFNPASGDTVGCAGTFQTNSFGVGASGFQLTNNPTVASSNIYSGTYIDLNTPGSGEQYKFVINNTGGTIYESPASTSGGNRYFLLASAGVTNPTVFWNDLNTNNIMLAPTAVTFTVDMTGAVDRFGNPFNPDNDLVLVDGNFVQPNWPVMGHFDDPFILGDYAGGHVMQRVTPSGFLYTNQFVLPAGTSIQVDYKYGILHDSGNLNTNVDNEAGFAANHTRYIRASSSYNFPTDIFGQQRTDQAGAIEPLFGKLAIGKATGGALPITWLGGVVGVHLQTTTNLIGNWSDINDTVGLNATNWPVGKANRYFRLVKP